MIDPNRQCLAQGTELLQALTDAQYAEPRGDWAPVGAQYRHVLDHYQCFLDGLEGGRIDYDTRSRDPDLERNRKVALEATAHLAARLAEATDIDPDRPPVDSTAMRGRYRVMESLDARARAPVPGESLGSPLRPDQAPPGQRWPGAAPGIRRRSFDSEPPGRPSLTCAR